MRRLLIVAAACLFTAATTVVAAPAQAADVLNTVYVQSTVRTARGEIQQNPPHIKGFVTNVDTGVRTPLINDGYRGQDWAFLPDGRYTLHVWHDTGIYNNVRSATSWWPGVYSAQAAATFTLRHDAPTQCDVFSPPADGCWGLFWEVQLEENRTLAGAVRERTATGVPGATVTATRNGESVTRFSAVTDAAGMFRMALPPGQYSLQTPNGATQTGIANFTVGAASQSVDLVLGDVPTPPRNVRASAGSKRVSVTWMAPTDTGGDGLGITEYRATATPGGQSCSVSGATGCAIDGLANNRQYTFTVTATNAVGTSAASSVSNVVTPLDPAPDAPADVRATAGDRTARVTWSPPAIGADTVTGYRVTSTPGGFSCTTRDLACELPRLQNGVSYIFRVTATSTGGQSASSEPSNVVTPAGVPSPPRNVQARAGNKSAYVSWNAPEDDGGVAVTGYTATAWPGGRICTTDGMDRSCAIGGLTNGVAYSVTVTATNRMGTSQRSPGSIPVTPDAKLASQKGSRKRAKLTRVGSSRGAVTVRWSATGTHRVRITWQKVGGKEYSKVTTPSGRVILRGRPSEQFLVRLTALGPGKDVSTAKVFRIPGG